MTDNFWLRGDEDGGVGLMCRLCDTGGAPVAYWLDPAPGPADVDKAARGHFHEAHPPAPETIRCSVNYPVTREQALGWAQQASWVLDGYHKFAFTFESHCTVAYPGDPEAHEHARRLASLAEAQRENARLLAAAVGEANTDGLPWRQIGEAVGLDASVVFRQHKAGSLISVLRPSHKASDPEKDRALAEVAAARLAAGQAQAQLAEAVTFARALGCPQAAIGRAEASGEQRPLRDRPAAQALGPRREAPAQPCPRVPVLRQAPRCHAPPVHRDHGSLAPGPGGRAPAVR